VRLTWGFTGQDSALSPGSPFTYAALGAGSGRHNLNLMVSYGQAYCISSIARMLGALLLVHGLFIGADLAGLLLQ
jgi:hypothetical protein